MSESVVRYKVDEATLANALQHTSLPLVRKDEHGNMFAVAAAPGAQQEIEADLDMAAGSSTDGASPPEAGVRQQPMAEGAFQQGAGSGGQQQQRPQDVQPDGPAGDESGGQQKRPASWG